MEGEERPEIGLAAIEEIADVEGEDAGQEQEDDDEDQRQGRGEIARQLAPEHVQRLAHVRPPSPMVTRRNPSSSRPGSTNSSFTCQPLARAQAPTASTIGWPS